MRFSYIHTCISMRDLYVVVRVIFIKLKSYSLPTKYSTTDSHTFRIKSNHSTQVCPSPRDPTTAFVFDHICFLLLLASLNSRWSGFFGAISGLYNFLILLLAILFKASFIWLISCHHSNQNSKVNSSGIFSLKCHTNAFLAVLSSQRISAMLFYFSFFIIFSYLHALTHLYFSTRIDIV